MFGRRTRAIGALLATLIVGACTETQFVERDPVNPPPDAASGFVGYFDASTKLTTCGNCHVTTQKQWETTAHASAWAALPANPPAYCAGCHTVNENGNSVDTAAGYNKVQSAAYHDVQCESCHGPGFAHATTPDAGAKPLARIGVTQDPGASCASCHSGTHTPFAEQWAASGHNDSLGMDHPATTAGCTGCHEGKAAVTRFSGGHAPRVADSVGTKTIVCIVCHDPHGSSNVAQLRYPIDTPDPTQNLCMQCHLRNATPTASFTRGGRSAHSAQGPILLGEGAGWMPPGFYFDSAGAFSSHGSSANPQLCAGCHVHRFTVQDSSGFIFQSTGHLFRPTPCVDGAGVPIADNTCAYTSTARNWSACTSCHATASVVANLFNNERNTVNTLVKQLWYDVNGNKVLDAYPTDSGYLAQIQATTPSEYNSANGLTTAEGALFNTMMLAEVTQYDHADGSYGVHNPFFYEALLASSISAVQTTYGLAPPPPETQTIMDKALARPAVRYTPPVRPTRVAARR